jgi:hypothetical protein
MQKENMVPLANTREKAEIVHKELLSPTRDRLQKPSEAFPYDPKTFLTSPTCSLHSCSGQAKRVSRHLCRPDRAVSMLPPAQFRVSLV